MFIPKANSKQKHVKKTQERETGDVITVQLASRVKSLAMASNDRLLSWKTSFSPQNPNFESPKPKFDHMVCSSVYKHQKRLKTI